MILCRFSDVQAHTEGPTGTIELLLWIQVLPPRSVAGTEAGVILFAYYLTLKTSLSLPSAERDGSLLGELDVTISLNL